MSPDDQQSCPAGLAQAQPAPDAPPPLESRAEAGKSANFSQIAAGVAKTAVAAALVFAATELASGRRAYLAYEASRRLWDALKKSRQSSAESDDARRRLGAAATQSAPIQQTMENVVQDVVDRGQRWIQRSKVGIVEATGRAREGFQQPAVRATLVGSAVLGTAATMGVLPAVMGAGTAFAVYRNLHNQRERRARGAGRGATLVGSENTATSV